MSGIQDQSLLDALLDSWDRNNKILVNLLLALPEGGLEARVAPDSPTVAELLTHAHYVRLVLIAENVPEFGVNLPEGEWRNERDPNRIAQMLDESAKAVRDAARKQLESGEPMKVHYDHPVLFLQHLIWHEGYHHGQIKLALKAIGRPLDDEEIGPVTWSVWFKKH